MANGEFVEILSKGANQELKEAISLAKELKKVVEQTNNITVTSKNTVSPSASAGNATAANASIQKTNQLRAQAVQAIFKEQKARESLERQKTKALASDAKEQAFLAKQESVYTKIQNKINGLSATYNNIAAKKELGLKLTDREVAQLSSLEGRLNRYQTVLKTVDQNIGRYQRNVGNYVSGFNPLNNAIGQITRELPNFGQSFSIGVLSLTNNIGALQDAISGLRVQNAALAAEGKPTQSIISQIGASFLSLNTLLFVSIGLFSAFAPQIQELVSGLFSSKKAIDAVKESTESLNSIRIEATKSVVDERIALESNLDIARDTTLSLKEREIAADNVLKQYPFWFENLGKEAILNGNVAEAVKGVNEALLARAKANAAVTKITENQSKIIDAEEQILAIQEKIASAENRARVARIRGRAASGAERGYEQEASALADIASYNEDIAALRKDIAGLNEVNNRLTGYSIEQAKTAIGLDYQAVAAKEMKIEKEVDYQASMFELQKAELQRQANYYKSTMENVENSYADREYAAKNLNDILNTLAELQLNESIRLAERETAERKKELLQQARDGEISTANANAVISSLEKDAIYKRKLAYENFSQGVESNNNQIAESFKNVFSTISEQENRNILGQKTVDNLRQIGLILQGAKGKNTVKEFEAIDKAIKRVGETQADVEIENLRNQRAGIEAQIEAISALEKNRVSNQALNDLKGKQLEIDKQLQEAENVKLTLIKQQNQEAAKLRETYYGTFTDLGQYGLGALNQFFDGSFQKLMEGTKLIEDANVRTREQFKITFLAITEVAQQAFAFIQQNTEARFQSMYAELEMQKKVADSFAINEAGKAEIERQYEEKRREIRRKELQAQKEQAIFNAVINTAQGVTAALPNFVLAALVGALGAAQIALISSREIPAYAEGTDNHKGGLALVGDGGKRELIWQPSSGYSISPDTDTLVNLEKGSKVFPDLTKTGLISNGLPTVNNVGGQQMTEAQLTRAVRKGMKGMSRMDLSITKNGVITHVNTEQGKIKRMNNSMNFKGGVV